MPRKGSPYLTKSRFQAGIYCPKRLWLDWYEPLLYEEAPPGSPQAVGTEIGVHAHKLFPGGVLILEQAYEHDQALARTRELMADASIPALFEAAFVHEGIQIRADVLERDGDYWHLHEVKSSTSVKTEYMTDVAVQIHVLRGSGVDLASAGVMHIDNTYVRGENGIDWPSFFTLTDILDEALALAPVIEEQIEQQKKILALRDPPLIPVGRYCKDCDYLSVCTGYLGEDWVLNLPRLTEKQLEAFQAAGIERISQIPDGEKLNATQEKVRKAFISGEEWVSPDLAKALRHAGPPAWYLDFETMSPAIPVYPGTRPFQRLPFQWSLHYVDGVDTLTHQAFLADGQEDPRRAFAQSIINTLGEGNEPVIVYSSFEKSVISDLMAVLPDLHDQLEHIQKRLFDLLPVTRGYIYHPDFGGSFSIKTVGPALAPEVSYDELDLISDGQAAAAAFVPIAQGELTGEEEQTICQALLDYCELDTLAMVEIHRALLAKL